MDNNNPVATPPQPTPAAQPTPPVATPPPVAGGEPKSQHMMLWLILGVVIVVVLIGGAYLFVNQSQPKEQAQAPDTLETELETVSVEEVDSEFYPVDQDLQTL